MTHRSYVFLALALSALALTGCHRRARRAEAVLVAQGGTAGGARAVTISHRHHRNLIRVAARDMGCRHREVTPQEVSPGIFAVSGCGQLRDYVMICAGRRHCRWVAIPPVEQVAMAETQCASGQILVQATGPLARQVSACGQTLAYGLACGGGACAWTRGVTAPPVMMQSEPGTTVIVIPDDGTAGAVAVQEAPPVVSGQVGDEHADVVQIDAAGTLQSLLATQLTALRTCTQGATVTLQVRWSAQGQVSVGLAAPHAGTPMETCVQQAFGSIVLQGVTAAGAVQATL
ncbi:MAG: hypothetical protein M3Y87_16680 [Myxococcota bacterium]|nr:hypothetical protein [Myxococcota bacterium]